MAQQIPYKIYLTEDEMPKAWYNVRADMKVKPAPLLNPGTLEPMQFDDLRPVFCDELIRQELDNDTPFFEIPEQIRSFYKMYRPSPLVRAYCLEEKLQTPAKIYYLAKQAFDGQYTPDVIKKWLYTFFRRFFQQQFKRSCLPDGPKVGSVTLSPRGDWRMPSDAMATLWLEEIEHLV